MALPTRSYVRLLGLVLLASSLFVGLTLYGLGIQWLQLDRREVGGLGANAEGTQVSVLFLGATVGSLGLYLWFAFPPTTTASRRIGSRSRRKKR